MKKYDPDSKETDAEFLRGIILPKTNHNSRIRRIADKLEALEKSQRDVLRVLRGRLEEIGTVVIHEIIDALHECAWEKKS